MENREAIDLIRQMIKDNEEDGGVEFGNKDKEALTLAISALEQERWIPVTERLPEIHKDVLVRDREVSDVYVSYYCGGGYWNTDTGGANNRIIAWRPLPEAYMEEDDA